MRSCPKILIVDDDREHVEMYRTLLEEEGCAVESANSPIEAMNLLGCKHFDVAVIELHDKRKTLAGWFAPDRRTPCEALTSFCHKIGCEYVIVSSERVKAPNGHAVIPKEDHRGILDHILNIACHSLI